MKLKYKVSTVELVALTGVEHELNKLTGVTATVDRSLMVDRVLIIETDEELTQNEILQLGVLIGQKFTLALA